MLVGSSAQQAAEQIRAVLVSQGCCCSRGQQQGAQWPERPAAQLLQTLAWPARE